MPSPPPARSSSPAPAASIRPRELLAVASPASLVGDPRGAVGQPDEPAQACRRRAWIPTGVWQLASSTRTAARSARRAGEGACVVRDRSTRVVRAVVARARLAARACPARARARTSSVSARRPRRDAEPLEPGGGEHERVRPRRASSLRSRVSTLPRSSTTSRSGRAASSCARRRSDARADARALAQRRRASARRPARRAASARGAASPTSSRARRPARPARPWPSAPRGRSRPPAARPRCASTQRDLSPRARACVARRW